MEDDSEGWAYLICKGFQDLIGDVIRAGSFVGISVFQEFCNAGGGNGDGVNFGVEWGGVEGMGLTRV